MIAKTDASFTEVECALLKSLVGKHLVSYEMRHIGGNDAWSTVRLNFEDCNIDVISALQNIEADSSGAQEEYSVLRAEKVSPNKPLAPDISSEVVVRSVDKTATGFSMARVQICFFEGEDQISDISFTQALLVNLGTEYLCIDKCTWFSEILTMTEGPDEKELVYDDSSIAEIDPEEKPDIKVKYTCEIIKI